MKRNIEQLLDEAAVPSHPLEETKDSIVKRGISSEQEESLYSPIVSKYTNNAVLSTQNSVYGNLIKDVRKSISLLRSGLILSYDFNID